MIVAMGEDDYYKTSPEWIAHDDCVCLLENLMNPMENLLASIMVVDGTTCVLGEQLKYEVVFMQMVITFFHDIVDPTEDLLTWTTKELAEGILKMLVPMLNHLATIIRNVQVYCKHLDFVHLQIVTYPDRVNCPNVDDNNYANF